MKPAETRSTSNGRAANPFEAVRATREAAGAVADDLITLGQWYDGAGQDDDTILRLYSGLSPIERDQVRKAIAERLGIRVSTLDDQVRPERAEAAGIDFGEPEPWDEPVDGSQLLEDLREAFLRYVAFANEAAVTCSLWVVHTYAFEAAETAPILAITSPDKRCGKSTLLSVLSSLVFRPAGGASFTKASIYRVIEKYAPTLLIDEADTFLRDNDDLRGVINSGHTRRMAHVWVCVGDNHEPTRFSTWAPKAIACIGKLPDTIADRSIEVPMRRKTAQDDVARYRERVVRELEPLRRMCRRWTDDNIGALREADPHIPDGLDDRAADSWATLLAVADHAGGRWPDVGRSAAEGLSGRGVTDTSTIRTELLQDIQAILTSHGKQSIPTSVLLGRLNSLDERPWPTFHRGGKELSARALASLLKPFGISSDTIRFADGLAKGYRSDAFTDAFSRYLADSCVTRVTLAKSSESEPKTLFSDEPASVTQPNPVTERISENRPGEAGNDDVTPVTLDSESPGGEAEYFESDGDYDAPF